MMVRVSNVLCDDITLRIGIKIRQSEKEVAKETGCNGRQAVSDFPVAECLSFDGFGASTIFTSIMSNISSCVGHHYGISNVLDEAKRWLPQKLTNKSTKNDKIKTSNTIDRKPCLITQSTPQSISIQIEDEQFDFLLTDTLQTLQKNIGKDIRIYEEESNRECASRLSLWQVLLPGNSLTCWDSQGILCHYYVDNFYRLSAVSSWLRSLGLIRYMFVFMMHSIEDYLSIPFITEETLRTMGIVNPVHLERLNQAISMMQGYTGSELVASWIYFLGFVDVFSVFIEKDIDLSFILSHSESDIREIEGLKGAEDSLWEIIGNYKKFSSVEETFKWLQRNGFEKYSFPFARYNIPFYALPYVNFFILNEMGGTIDDKILLNRLQSLKHSPAYHTNAVTFWLRDLELENYSASFAKHGFHTLHSLSLLDDAVLGHFALQDEDITKLRTGIHEMKEFQFYYSATTSLLQKIGLSKYASIFEQQGISIDILSLLTEKQLQDIGVSNREDRKMILKEIALLSFSPDDLGEPLYPLLSPSVVTSASEDLSRPPNLKQAGQEEKSVDDWLQYINEPSSTSSRKQTRKIRKKSNSTKIPRQTGSSPPLPKPLSFDDTDMNNNNMDMETETESSGPMEKLVMLSPHMYSKMNECNSAVFDFLDEYSSLELEKLNAEVEAVRKRIDFSTPNEISSASIFSSID